MCPHSVNMGRTVSVPHAGGGILARDETILYILGLVAWRATLKRPTRKTEAGM